MKNTKEDVTQLEIITITCAEKNDVSPSCDDEDSNSSGNSDYVSTSFVVEDTEVVSLDNRELYLKENPQQGTKNELFLETTNKASYSCDANTNSSCLAELECNGATYNEFTLSDEEKPELGVVTSDVVIKSESPKPIFSVTRTDPESVSHEVNCRSFSHTNADCTESTQKYDSKYHEDEFTGIFSYLCDTDNGRGQVDETITTNWNNGLSGNINTNLVKCEKDSTCKTHKMSLPKCVNKVAMNNTRDAKTFVCEFCNEKFSSKAKLRVHIRTHTGQKTHKCKFCGDVFPHSWALRRHIRKHTGENFPCPICKVEYPSKQGLQLHINLHNPVKPYSCDKCNKRFSASNSLNYHLKRCGQTVDSPCFICEKIFGGRESLESHLKTHEIVIDPLTNARGYTCKICNNIMKSIPYYKTHLQFHNTKCKICLKTFDDSAVLKTHLASAHSKVKLFLCDICGKGFNYSFTLAAHKKVHNGQSPHVCQCCQKVFSNPHILREHTFTHTKEKPYTCEFCSHRFTWRSNLRNHLNFGENAFHVCKICQKSIPRRCLKGHLATHDVEECCLVTVADDTPNENDKNMIVPVEGSIETQY